MTQEAIDEKKSALREELYQYFVKEQYRIDAAKGITGHRHPLACHNDGYGDQQDKQPDILAYDPRSKSYAVGITRATREELDSDGSLTEYNVFLDQKDPATGTPFRLYIIVPESLVNDLTSLIHHYIHREYWFKVIIVSSQIIG
ncbi:MAG TPA: hypothetical protein VKS81_05995 [Bacteroidota bacterium]|nr:hypothetical protein [Bacteroidota bacterium]